MAATVKLENKLLLFAVQTRCTLIILQIIFNNLIPDHDAGVFNPPTNIPSGILDKFVETMLGGLNRWDAVYFMHISEHGYIYQNSLAFFPMFPFLIRIVANSLCYPLQFVLTYKNVLMISAVVFNVFVFLLTVKLLFRLGRNVLGNTYTAYKACLLFCINPASIFMMAFYSETLYFCLVVYGLVNFESNRKVMAVFLFALSSLCRSNGLLNLGFIFYDSFIFIVMIFTNFLSGVSKPDGNPSFRLFTFFGFMIIQLIYLLILILLFAVPFILYQFYYINTMFCKSGIHELSDIPKFLIDYGLERGYHIIGDSVPRWCHFTIPLSYADVQNTHWGVGFMKYYEFKQIPNFLLALPVTVTSGCCVMCYYVWNTKACWTLGIKSDMSCLKKSDEGCRCLWNNPRLLPYVVHLLALTVFGWMFVHIQVLTRMLFSASPLLYWFVAYCTTDETKTKVPIRNQYDVMKISEDISKVEKEENLQHSVKNIVTDQIMAFWKQTVITKFILAYFLIYFIVGTFMFSNFLPWT